MLRSELNVLDSRNLDWSIAYMCFYAFDDILLSNSVFTYFGAQVVHVIPRPHKSLCK
jgi:hypothetical protein